MTDFHIHTSYCDGNDTPREMVEEAINRGFSAIGFSGHSYVSFDDCCMSLENTEHYRRDIATLKQEFDGRLEIFCGIEQDFYSPYPPLNFDYVIGSVHYIKKGDEYHPVDLSLQVLDKLLEEHYNNDFDSFAEDYFQLLTDVVSVTNADIIGHFDLLSKFSEQYPRPFTDRYKTAALTALHELLKYDRPFEINVGAITRGYRTSPYPADFILKEIRSQGGRIIINGDCHNKLWLGDHLDTVRRFAVANGFKTEVILTNDGFKEIAI